MKFEEWYLKNRQEGSHVDIDDAEKGWIACKQEVLKFISEELGKEECFCYLKSSIIDKI